MSYMYPLVLTIHILVGVSVIGLVLLQHGKGADMGAAFGSGSSGSLFGASGSANFMSRTTGILAAVFFMTSLGLAYMANAKPAVSGSVMDAAVQQVPATAPADVPAPAKDGSKAQDIPK
ncbi:MAG: preprotein translocase subunit SecG [Gammaproteobacteria bacterium]|nr:preprotein translocase subunit SecG [Gammaproteobacteria bacterium]MBU1647215.1 preprotein translocase subunit SecG [Gammaproteobacteria bacterium]MBU1972727.1 preprotein translocase subunit SecG [Gammaproteobacteria bacterium]